MFIHDAALFEGLNTSFPVSRLISLIVSNVDILQYLLGELIELNMLSTFAVMYNECGLSIPTPMLDVESNMDV